MKPIRVRVVCAVCQNKEVVALCDTEEDADNFIRECGKLFGEVDLTKEERPVIRME